MLTELSVGGLYVPPFFVYACLAVPLFHLMRYGLARSGVLRSVWHPALFEFALSLMLVCALLLLL